MELVPSFLPQVCTCWWPLGALFEFLPCQMLSVMTMAVVEDTMRDLMTWDVGRVKGSFGRNNGTSMCYDRLSRMIQSICLTNMALSASQQ